MQLFITLVHGTWPHGSPFIVWLRRLFRRPTPPTWTSPGSRWYRHFEALGPAEDTRPIVESFEWSGHNRVFARERAAHDLAEYTRLVSLKHPDRYHVLIAHSHGGSVAMHAMGNLAVAPNVIGLICLATPFIHAQPRPATYLRRKLTAVSLTASMILMLLVLRLWAATYGAPGFWVSMAVILVVTALAFAVVLPLQERWTRFGERVRVACALPSKSRFEALIVRGAADEASGLLGLSSFLSAITARVWFAVGALEQKALRWEKGRSLLPFLMGMATGLALMAIAILSGLPESVTIWIAVAGAVFMVLGLLSEPHAPALALHALGNLLVLMLVPIETLVLVFFGWELALAGVFLDISAEATPPGVWTLYHFDPQAESDMDPRRPVRHSALHQDDHTLYLAMVWIARWVAMAEDRKERARRHASNEAG